MNRLTRWFLAAVLFSCGVVGCTAPVQAAQAVASTGGTSRNTITPSAATSHHGGTGVQIGPNGVNIASGSSRVVIGGTGVHIFSGSKSVVITNTNPPCTNGREIVEIGHEARLAAGEKACDVVSIFGDSVAHGDVSDSVVAIMGDLHVTGSVGNSTVSVFGDSNVNGPVAGNAVAIFGDLTLGPKAIIQGQAVNVFGSMHRAAGSVIRGGTVNLMSGVFQDLHGLHGLKDWSEQCLILGRLLAPRLDIGWAWGVALGILLFYALLALLFSEGVQHCIQTLDDHPGGSILAALAMMLLTPILMLALVFTIVGVFAIPLFWLALIGVAVFGRVVALGWVGARILRGMHSGATQPVLYVLLGGALALLLYMVPVLGFIIYGLIGLLGFGAVLYSLMVAMRRARGTTAPGAAGGSFGEPGTTAGPERPAVSSPAAAAGTEGPAASASATAEPPGTAGEAGTAAPAPAPMEFSTLPRAGFWIRMLALLIDVVLVGVVLSLIGDNGANGMLLVLAGYGALMWKLRGTTVGGIICHLRVVRIDGQPVNWETAILRALGCFLSLVAAGLGFFWIAFDRDHQAWHDKIAGTVVVLVPRGRGLL